MAARAQQACAHSRQAVFRTWRFAGHQLHAGDLAEGLEALCKLGGRDNGRHAAHKEADGRGDASRAAALLRRRRRHGCGPRALHSGGSERVLCQATCGVAAQRARVSSAWLLLIKFAA